MIRLVAPISILKSWYNSVLAKHVAATCLNNSRRDVFRAVTLQTLGCAEILQIPPLPCPKRFTENRLVLVPVVKKNILWL